MTEKNIVGLEFVGNDEGKAYLERKRRSGEQEIGLFG